VFFSFGFFSAKHMARTLLGLSVKAQSIKAHLKFYFHWKIRKKLMTEMMLMIKILKWLLF